MSRLFLILLLVCAVSATRCIIRDNKNEPEVHVIRLGNRSGESEDTEVVTLHIPDRRRKRQSDEYCKKDSDCPPEHVCLTPIGCLKGYRRYRSTP